MENIDARAELNEAERLRRRTEGSWSIGQSRLMVAVVTGAALYDLVSGGSTLARLGSFAWCAAVAVYVVRQNRKVRVQPTRRQWLRELACWLAVTALVNVLVVGLGHMMPELVAVAVAVAVALLFAALVDVSHLRHA